MSASGKRRRSCATSRSRDLLDADDVPLLTLSQLAPDLPAPLAGRAIALALQLEPPESPTGEDRNVEYRLVTLAYLAAWLPEDLLEPVALNVVTASFMDVLLPALRRLGPRLSPALLGAVIEETGEHYNEFGKAPIFATLLPFLAEDGRGERAEAIYDFARDIDIDDGMDSLPGRRCELMTLLAPSLEPNDRRDAPNDARRCAEYVRKPADRAKALTALAREQPAEQRLTTLVDALAAAASTDHFTTDAVGQVARAASTLTQARWSAFWRPALRVSAAKGRTDVAKRIADAATDIARLGGPGAVKAVVASLDAVVRWWP